MTSSFRMTRLSILVALVGFAGACGQGSDEPSQVGSQPIPQPQQAQPQQAQPQPTQASNFGTVALEPGFVPDPHVVTGTSGGSVDASTLNASCSGWVSSTPDHILDARSAFGTMRILAHSTGDVTLVLQKPDGSYVCNDDSEGTDPVVESALAAGSYRIWVGSYQQGTNAAYRLGFSELGSTHAASL